MVLTYCEKLSHLKLRDPSGSWSCDFNFVLYDLQFYLHEIYNSVTKT